MIDMLFNKVRPTLFVILIVSVAIFNGCGGTSTPSPLATASETEHPDELASVPGTSPITIPHIHGLGYSPDGKQLIVPAHDGLRLYVDGQWQRPPVPAHDYMGFVVTDDGFYSSGHPDPTSGMTNPLGLIKSTDGGQTVTTLGFVGETDFHFMAVGYHNHALYVGNPAPNSQLQAGIHYSLDTGKSWQSSKLSGVTGQLIQMAVHPHEAAIVVLSTEEGLFLSQDYANTFQPIVEPGPVTAVTFTRDGNQLAFGFQHILIYDLARGESTSLPSPGLAAEDAISHIAINPTQSAELAVATFNRDIFLSKDNGQQWIQLVDDGRSK
jgi:hypothetical protein